MQKLDPKAVWIFFIRILIGWFIFFAIFSIWLAGALASLGLSSNILTYILIAIAIFILLIFFSWFWAKLTYRFFGYQLTENAFKKENGVIWKRYVSIPYERIQNVDINRGIIARILGLSDLYIQTAGYSAVYSKRGSRGIGAEGYLPGLGEHIAEQLREELISRAKGKGI